MNLDKALALKAFQFLDTKIGQHISAPVIITIGGGGAMIMHHDYDGATYDIDGIANKAADKIKLLAEEIATELNIAHDWLNPHFDTYTYFLPDDAKDRIEKTFQGHFLTVNSLGVEDLLIMKFMAGRNKDLPHITHLLKKSPNLQIVENRLYELVKIKKSEADKALELFYELTDK